MDDFQRELLARLPLARGVLELFSYVLAPPFLDDLFEEHRGRCYERELSFPQVVHLMRDCLLVHGGSARQSFTRARERGELPVALTNAYGKLARLPLPLSVAFLAEGAARLRELSPGTAARPLPPSLEGFDVVAVDGKKLKNAPKRLKPLRGSPGKLLGAKLLVALDLRSDLVLAMSVSEDGERNDVPLVPALLPQVLARSDRPVLWVADRQFCDLNLPGLFTLDRGHFLLRWSRKLHFHPDPLRPSKEGVDGRGRRFVQEWGWLGGEKDGRRRYVRRVTLHRPGEEDVALVTDLLDESAYPAGDLLEAYLMRWGIENVFQQVSEVFGLRKLVGSTPRAGVFQAAFCLLLYDMVQVMRAFAAGAGGRAAREVSAEMLFYDVRQELVGWAAAGEPAYAAAHLGRAPAAQELRRTLSLAMRGRWTGRWVKSKNKNPRKPQKHAKGSGAHTSVWRVLQAHRTAARNLQDR